VTGGDTFNLFAFYAAVLSRFRSGGYTMDMSKSNQSVRGFLTSTIIPFTEFSRNGKNASYEPSLRN